MTRPKCTRPSHIIHESSASKHRAWSISVRKEKGSMLCSRILAAFSAFRVRVSFTVRSLLPQTGGKCHLLHDKESNK